MKKAGLGLVNNVSRGEKNPNRDIQKSSENLDRTLEYIELLASQKYPDPITRLQKQLFDFKKSIEGKELTKNAPIWANYYAEFSNKELISVVHNQKYSSEWAIDYDDEIKKFIGRLEDELELIQEYKKSFVVGSVRYSDFDKKEFDGVTIVSFDDRYIKAISEDQLKLDESKWGLEEKYFTKKNIRINGEIKSANLITADWIRGKLADALTEIIQKLEENGASKEDIIEFIGRLLTKNSDEMEDSSAVSVMLNGEFEKGSDSLIKFIDELNWDNKDKIKFIKEYAKCWGVIEGQNLFSFVYSLFPIYLERIVQLLQKWGQSNEQIFEFLEECFHDKFSLYEKCFFAAALFHHKTEVFEKALNSIVKVLDLKLGLNVEKIKAFLSKIVDAKHTGMKYIEFLNDLKDGEQYQQNYFDAFEKVKLEGKSLSELLKIQSGGDKWGGLDLNESEINYVDFGIEDENTVNKNDEGDEREPKLQKTNSKDVLNKVIKRLDDFNFEFENTENENTEENLKSQAGDTDAKLDKGNKQDLLNTIVGYGKFELNWNENRVGSIIATNFQVSESFNGARNGKTGVYTVGQVHDVSKANEYYKFINQGNLNFKDQLEEIKNTVPVELQFEVYQMCYNFFIRPTIIKKVVVKEEFIYQGKLVKQEKNVIKEAINNQEAITQEEYIQFLIKSTDEFIKQGNFADALKAMSILVEKRKTFERLNRDENQKCLLIIKNYNIEGAIQEIIKQESFFDYKVLQEKEVRLKKLQKKENIQFSEEEELSELIVTTKNLRLQFVNQRKLVEALCKLLVKDVTRDKQTKKVCLTKDDLQKTDLAYGLAAKIVQVVGEQDKGDADKLANYYCAVIFVITGANTKYATTMDHDLAIALIEKYVPEELRELVFGKLGFIVDSSEVKEVFFDKCSKETIVKLANEYFHTESVTEFMPILIQKGCLDEAYELAKTIVPEVDLDDMGKLIQYYYDIIFTVCGFKNKTGNGENDFEITIDYEAAIKLVREKVEERIQIVVFLKCIDAVKAEITKNGFYNALSIEDLLKIANAGPGRLNEVIPELIKRGSFTEAYELIHQEKNYEQCYAKNIPVIVDALIRALKKKHEASSVKKMSQDDFEKMIGGYDLDVQLRFAIKTEMWTLGHIQGVMGKMHQSNSNFASTSFYENIITNIDFSEVGFQINK